MCENTRHTNVAPASRSDRTMLMLSSSLSGLSPEIVHFRIPGDGINDALAPDDLYIKGSA